MEKNNSKYTSKSLQQLNEQLDAQYENERLTTKSYERTLLEMEKTFYQAKSSSLMQWLEPQRWKQNIRHAGAYILGRRNVKRLYSRTYKRKQASNDIKPYVRLLYEEGFKERALFDLQEMFHTTTNKYLKRAIANELALFYANEETDIAAKHALLFIKIAKSNERNEALRRQLTIIEAECFVRIGEKETAKKAIQEELNRNIHPDLYLALANTEEALEKRIEWYNKTLQLYGRQPIQLDLDNNDVTNKAYNVLSHTKETGNKQIGPKISVILPAYNSEDSIHLAIESILKQTWSNLELIIVDDCSTDRTNEVIAQYVKQDKRIIHLQNEKNSGAYVARNLGLQKATGEFVTVNDADDWSHEEKLAVQATHLINHPHVIANTSEQSRLTSDFYFHRRGTRGKYIFSNMSSLMFRRKEVMEKIGFWDSVRFAADGEFKRRLIKQFGKDAIVDLPTGPLSLPEQSATSLTGSSAFGYSGYFMGARKEYVEAFTNYHNNSQDLYYPFETKSRLFPVPEPMLPERKREERNIDIVIIANYYDLSDDRANIILEQIEVNKQKNLTTGLVQLYDYNKQLRKRTFNKKIRQAIDGTHVQMLVYGEKLNAPIVLIHSVESLAEKQRYVPTIRNRITLLIIDELPNITYNSKKGIKYNVRQVIRQAREYFSPEIRIYPINQIVRKELEEKYKRELGTIRLAKENWLSENESLKDRYPLRLNDWLVEEHDYTII